MQLAFAIFVAFILIKPTADTLVMMPKKTATMTAAKIANKGRRNHGIMRNIVVNSILSSTATLSEPDIRDYG